GGAAMSGPGRPRRRLTLGALLVLVMGTAPGLALLQATIAVVNARDPRGPYTIFSIIADWAAAARRVPALAVVHLASDVAGLLLSCVGGWSFLLPILAARTSPGAWRRSLREPGVTACLASMAGLGLSLLALGGAMAIECAVYGRRLRRGFALWFQAYLLGE